MTHTLEDRPPGQASLDTGIANMLGRRGAEAPVRRGEPVTFGLPLPRGAAVDAGTLTLVDERDRPVPVDARVLDRWPDGSIRWVLVDAQVTVPAEAGPALRLRHGRRAGVEPVRVDETAGGLAVDTGAMRVHLAPGGASPFRSVVVRGVAAIDAGETAFLASGRDAAWTVRFDRVSVEDSGTLRVVVAAEGVVRDARGRHALDLLVRLHFFAGSSAVRVLVRTRNPRPAQHPGGFWDLGDPASVYLKDFSLRLAVPVAAAGLDGAHAQAGDEPAPNTKDQRPKTKDQSPAPTGQRPETRDQRPTVSCSPETGRPLEACALPFSIYQDSSGGEYWRSTNHVNRERRVPVTFRGYRLRSGDAEHSGLRATPIVMLRRGAATVAVAVPHFWQNFPKAIDVAGDALTIGLFPGSFADLHEIQPGEQKTHEIFVGFGDDAVSDEPFGWCRARLVPHAEPEWYCASGAIPFLTPAGCEADRPRTTLLRAAIEGPDTFERKREVVDQYGWRHFGEIYGDHEAVRQPEPPLVSHYNNQYDPIGGFAVQFLRSGDLRWWTQMEELAAHVVDIDIYHTDGDKVAYNRGLFWHTYHYGDADTATHRTYPRAGAGQTHGGGPSGEHNYTSGLVLHYFLTGDRASREAAVDLARYVIDSDDGTQTIFRFLDGGSTGLPTASGSTTYHGPGRGAGNSLNALIDGYRLTGDRMFLDKADTIVRRCIHPADDVPARSLLDVERKWFYTMFLQALGAFLDLKAERGEIDWMYAYARASLLHYARWMADYETPYLDHPERLEFPTETWPAQDIRKSDVFYHAMRHASGTERERFAERGGFFYRSATTTLAGMPTRTLARPVVLLLSNGLLHGWVHSQAGAEPVTPAGPEPADFGRPEVFVPQRVRAKARAVYLAAGGAAAAAAGLVYLVL